MPKTLKDMRIKASEMAENARQDDIDYNTSGGHPCL